MSRRLESDRILFGAVVILVLFGAVMVYSASAVMAADKFGSSYYFLLRQVLWAVAGLIAMVGLMNLDYHRLRSPRLLYTATGLQVVLLVAVLFSDRSHNTHRWIRMGSLGFQPAEFSKIVIILFLAYFLEMRKGKVNDLKHTLAPIGLIAGLTIVLILKEPDFGTSFAVAMVVGAMLFAAGLNLRYFAFALLAMVPPVYWLVFHVSYRYNRILAFLNPYSDPLGKGFQIIQSFIAVGTGGITGAGLMEGKQKLFYLPEPQTDFIFAVIGEELGFLGAVLLITLFFIILMRGLRAATACSDEFGRLLAIGITVMIVGQALVNVSVVVGLLPTKGIPLPFVSYGGSSLLMMLVAAGVLLNVSQHAS
jgi:cell division protein FtsW